MSQILSVLGWCVLFLLARNNVLRTFARGTLQYSANATDLVPSENLESPFPYYFPELEHFDNLFPMPDCNGVILEEATVDQLQDAMNKGRLTSAKIALCYLQRIYQTDEYTK